MSEEKRCSACETTKPVTEFYVRRTVGGHRNVCTVCHKAAVAERNKRPDVRERKNAQRRAYRKTTAGRAAAKDERLRHRYGLTAAGFVNRLAEQGGVCAICACPPPEGDVLCVDHDHENGAVRALLCRTCNIGIGHLNDDPALVRKAAEYLESYA